MVTRRDASTQRQIDFVAIFIAKSINYMTTLKTLKFEKEKNTMIKATQTHHGQYRPYGDSYDVWMVEADEEMEFDDVLAWCRENLIGGSMVPLRNDFLRRYRNDKTFAMGDYFSGYVELHQYPDKTWKFEKVVPYAD